MHKTVSKKFSKRKKILFIFLLILLTVIPILLYFVLNKKESDKWYSSDWNYRRALYLDNSKGMDLNDEDILIELDTKSLIAEGKMQGDCDDLRILDSDNSTSLKYWIEGGCNTESTQIWVKIPSFPSDGKTIYAYYGNTKSPNAEEQWEGSFLMFSDSAACSDGWYKTTEYNGEFLYGSNVSGIEGGSNSHLHKDISFSTKQNYLELAECNGNCEENTYISTENSSYLLSLSESNNIPPYYTLSACESNDLKYTSQIAYFDISKLSDGWTYFSNADNKFIMIDSIAGLTGGREEHTHQVTTIPSAERSSLNYKYTSFLGSTDQKGTSSGNFSAVYIDSASNIPSYEVLELAESSDEESFGKDNMILAVTELPPLGWEYFSDLENKFPLTGESVGNTGGSNFHTHSAEFFTFTKASDESNSGDSLQISPVSATLSEESNLPEYTTVVYAKRKTSINVSIEEEETNTNNEEGKNSSITGVEDKESNTGTTDDGNVKGAATSVPTNLLVEGESAPKKVTDATPEFSAIFTDPDTGDTGEYYQIQVNTSSDFTGTSMWDSGKTSMSSTARNSRCPDITYGGSTLLTDGQEYFWRIRFWDDEGNVSSWAVSSSSSLPIIDSYSETNTDSGDTLGEGTNTKKGQSFTGNDGYLDSAIFYIKKIGSPTGTATVSIFAHTGTFGSSSRGTGSALATSNQIDISSLTTSYQLITFYFSDSNKILLSNSTHYVAVVEYSGGNASNYIALGVDTTSPTHNGNRVRYTTSWDYNGSWDIPFYIKSQEYNGFVMSAGAQASGLLVDDTTNPIFLDTASPSFSAICTDVNGDNCSAYQIIVNTSSDFNGTEYWNSGKISTSIENDTRASDIPYKGKPLANSGITLYWKIIFWDTDDLQGTVLYTGTFVDSYPSFDLSGVKLEGIKIN